MATLLFIPVKTAMQVLCSLRLCMATASIIWISLNSPETSITGSLGNILNLVLPGSTYLNVIIPTLTVEVKNQFNDTITTTFDLSPLSPILM